MDDDISVAQSERPWHSRCASTLRRNGDDHVHSCWRHNGHTVRATIDEPLTPYHECNHIVREGTPVTEWDELLGCSDTVYCDVRWDEHGRRLP